MDKNESLKTAQIRFGRHIPKQLKPHSDKKKGTLPFESLDYSLNNPRSKCASFKTTQERMLGWTWALHRLYVEEKNDFTKFYELDVKFCKDNCRDEVKDDECANILSVKLLHSNPVLSDLNCTLRFYLTSGTLMVQGNGYKEWGSVHLTPLLAKVNEYVEYCTNVSNTTVPKSPGISGLDTTASCAASSDTLESSEGSKCQSEAADHSTESSPSNSKKTAGQESTSSSSTNTSPKTPKDIYKLKQTLLNRAHRIASDRDKDITELCTKLDNDVVDAHDRIDSIHQEIKDTEVKLDRQLKVISNNISSMETRSDEIINTLAEIKANQIKIVDELQNIRKKEKPKTIVELPKEHKDTMDGINVTLKALQSIVLDMGKITPSMTLPLVVDSLNDRVIDKEDKTRTERVNINRPTWSSTVCDNNSLDKEDKTRTVRVDVNRPTWSSTVSDNNSLDLAEGKRNIFLGDSNFSNLRADMLESNSASIRVLGGADVHDMITFIHKVADDYTSAKSVLIHVGFKDSKSQVDENIIRDKLTCLIETATSTFPRAMIGLSAVLPGRNNKNRSNIDKYNEVMKKVCNEKMAQFIDWTSRFEKGPGRPDRELYRDEVHPNSRGIKEIVQGINAFTEISKNTIDLTKDTAVSGNEMMAKPPGLTNTAHKATDGDPIDQQQTTLLSDNSMAKDSTHSTSQVGASSTQNNSTKDTSQTRTTSIQNSINTPDIKCSETMTDSGNTFTAYSAVIVDMPQMRQVLRALYSKQNVEKATSNSVAYRFRNGAKLVQRWEDDGERGAGKAIMEVLQARSVENIMVVVSRHFRSHIGPQRFTIIKQCTFEAVQPFLSLLSSGNPIATVSSNNGTAVLPNKGNRKPSVFNQTNRLQTRSQTYHIRENNPQTQSRQTPSGGPQTYSTRVSGVQNQNPAQYGQYSRSMKAVNVSGTQSGGAQTGGLNTGYPSASPNYNMSYAGNGGLSYQTGAYDQRQISYLGYDGGGVANQQYYDVVSVAPYNMSAQGSSSLTYGPSYTGSPQDYQTSHQNYQYPQPGYTVCTTPPPVQVPPSTNNGYSTQQEQYYQPRRGYC